MTALSPASYWMPLHYPVSGWVRHASFASWIVDAARPQTIVELGTHNGYSLFVLAEAVRRLGLPTRVFALDSWEGDDHAGIYEDEVYESVKSIADAEYATTVELVRGYFADSVSRFADGSIDLLHIDGRHGYEDVREDYEAYLPKLSSRAVVLFHDTHEFQPGFGVHRYWDELANTAPSFNFHHGHGLGVLAVGTDVPRPVLDFIALANGAPEEVRATYDMLGDEVERIYELHHRVSRVDVLERELDAVKRSTSWRVSAPVRAIGRVLGRR